MALCDVTTVPSTTGMDLGTQLFVGNEPDPLRIIPASTSSNYGYINKPRGGLWTSTLRDGASGWVDWCRSEDFGSVDTATWWLITPRDDARLVEIDSLSDLEMVLGTFCIAGLWTHTPERRTIDFDAMIGAGFSGLHLTKNGASDCHVGDWLTGLSLKAWDCESTVWFHWSFTDICEVRP